MRENRRLNISALSAEEEVLRNGIGRIRQAVAQDLTHTKRRQHVGMRPARLVRLRLRTDKPTDQLLRPEQERRSVPQRRLPVLGEADFF